MRLPTEWRAPLTALVFVSAVACSGGTPGSVGGDAGGGDGGPPKASLSATALDFGGLDCGGAAPEAKTITLTNDGGSALTWSATLAQSDAFSIDGAASGTLAPGQTANVAVAAKAVPSSSKAGDAAETTLTITTSDPDKATTTISVKRTAQGATFEAMPALADFGELPVLAQSPDVKLTVRNVGNKPASVSLATSGDFGVAWAGSPSDATLAPNEELQGAVARFKPTTNKPQTGSAKLLVKGAVCGELPSIPLKGTGTNGVAGVSPGTLNYGLVDCGTQAVAQQVSLLNTGNASFTFTATLGKGNGSPYALSAASGTVLAGNQVQILVTPKAVPQVSATTNNLYGDSLTITTSAIGDTPHTVSLEQTAKGAILSLGGAISFGGQKVGTSPSQTLVLTNSGNVAAPVTLSVSAPFSTASSTTVQGGSSANLAIAYAPDAKALGVAANGSLGVTTNVNLCAPLPDPASLSGSSYDRASQLAAGDSSTCALATSGNVYCWGDDAYGQLGDGTGGGGARTRAYPVQSLSGTITQLVSAGVSVCALKSNNTVSCWGANYYGQLGNNTTTDSATPVAVSGLSDATKLAAGRSWVCGVRQGGSVGCWGSNYDGQLGNGTTTESHVPVAVGGLTDAIGLGGGYSTACAIRQGGAMSCWGGNYYGQLGNGLTTSTTAPVAVLGLANATATAWGQGNHNCAIRQGGTVACWGSNSYGQLGNGTTTSATTFVTVGGLVDATALALGMSHSCALRQGGSVSCWGDNYYGELGNGTTTASTSPTAVSNLASVSAVSAGSDHTCAMRSNGTVVCWGANGYGQLGNASTTSSLIPVEVAGLN